MLRFGGFKATLNLLSNKKKSEFNSKESPGEPICGAYRRSQGEFSYNVYEPDPPKKITPAMVQLPRSKEALKPFKSTSDITKSQAPSANLHASTPNVSQEPQNISINSNVTKEQKKLEKQQKSNQRKQEKMAAREQQRQEKLRKEKEKQENKLKAKSDKSKTTKKDGKSPKEIQTSNQPVIPQTSTKKQKKNSKQSLTNQQSSVIQQSLPNQQSSTTQQSSAQHQSPIPTHSTNTLESSISKSSGPPPYSATEDAGAGLSSNPGNISFAKSTEDISSWDMISHHREQMNRHLTVKDTSKQTRMDLQYNVGSSNASRGNANSEA